MSGGVIEYRCRRCGVLDRPIHVPDVQQAIIDLLNRGKVSGDGVPAGLTHAHYCKDGGMGLAACEGVIADDRLGERAPLLADGWTLLSWTRSEQYREWVLCVATEREGGVVVWWSRSDEGHWRRERVSSTYDEGNLPDSWWQPPLREGP